MDENRDLIQSLVDLQIPNHIRLSPVGDQIVYSTELNWGHWKNGSPVSTLWCATLNEPRSSRRVFDGDYFDCQPAWHPDGQRIGFVSDRGRSGSSAIYMHKMGTDEAPRPITSVENDQPILTWAFSPNGLFVAYISTDEKTKEQIAQDEMMEIFSQVDHPRLRVINLQTGEIRKLELDSSIEQLCWSPNGTEIAFVHSSRPELEQTCLLGMEISAVDSLNLSSVRQVCRLPGRAEGLVWPVDERLYFTGSVPLHSDCSGTGLYAANPMSTSGSCEHVLSGNEDDVMNLRQVKGSVVAQVQARMSNKLLLLDGTVLYEKQQELEAFDVVRSPQGVGVVVSTSNINQPVEVFQVQNEGEMLIQLSTHGKAFETRQFGKCNFLQIPIPPEPLRDSSLLLRSHPNPPSDMDAMYIMPTSSISSTRDLPTKPLPTVVLIHGGPDTALTNSFNAYYFTLAPYLLSLGYGLLIPNYRGSSSRGFNFASQILGAVGKVDHADIITATHYAIDHSYADPEKLVVGGYSHGGFLSCCCAVRNGQHARGWKFQAAFVGALFCDADAMALESDMGTHYPSSFIGKGLPWTRENHDTRSGTASPLWEFGQIMAETKQSGKEPMIPPILIFHGQKDFRCPVSQAWGLRRALQHYDLPFECVIYREVSHFVFEQKALIDLVLRIGKWCDRYIG